MAPVFQMRKLSHRKVKPSRQRYSGRRKGASVYLEPLDGRPDARVQSLALPLVGWVILGKDTSPP